jgi:nicotinamidase-related amidase
MDARIRFASGKEFAMTTQALIIIDMLNDFIHPEGALYCGKGAEEIVPVIYDQLERCRKDGDAVIYLQDSHATDDKEFEKFPPHCVTGTWGNRIIDALAPADGEHVIAKTRYSGFYGTDLDQVLTQMKPDRVIVAGVCTSICVMDTVGGLVNRDFAVSVPANAVADFDSEAHMFSLKRMEKIYGAQIV